MTEITYVNGRAVETQRLPNGIIKYKDRPQNSMEELYEAMKAEQRKIEMLESAVNDWRFAKKEWSEMYD
jgi:hypothetical protein